MRRPRAQLAGFFPEAPRQRQLQERGIAAQSQLDEAEVELVASRQQVSALQEKLRTVLAGLGGDPESAVELHPAFLAAEAERERCQGTATPSGAQRRVTSGRNAGPSQLSGAAPGFASGQGSHLTAPDRIRRSRARRSKHFFQRPC